MTTTVRGRTAAPRSPAASLGYHAALDGLRGIALLAIIVYHSGVDAAPGAFLSVSTFFTLSGFLITALLLAEHHQDGAISLRGFWQRRLRRLMPAALAAIALIAVAAVWFADATQWVRLRADGLAALLYVANWRFIAVGDSYGAAFDSPSPFTHFWTLAIEEQFYVMLPLVVAGVLVAARGNRRVLAVALGGAAVASLAWSNWLVGSGATIDRLYFGTDVRLAELLAGALLAVWWMRRPEPVGPRGRAALGWLGPVALVVVVVLWATADLQETAFYRGGLALYSLLTLTIIASGMQEGSPVQRVLSWRPLVWVGTVSYAAYLVHYPVLVWLRIDTSLPGWARLAVAVPFTFAVAALSAKFLERPIRRGGVLPTRLVLPAAAGGVAAVAAALVLLTAVVQPVDAVDLDAARTWQRYLEQTAAQDRSDAPRITSYGDSTALMTGRGLDEVSRRRPDEFVARGGWAELGCGLISGGERRIRGEVEPFRPECRDWLGEWQRTSAQQPADVAVVQVGPWEVLDQRLERGGPWLTIGEDPELDAAIEASLRRAVATLLEHNGMVVILSSPDVDFGSGSVGGLPESDPARMERFREIESRVAATTDRVEVVDLAGWVARQEARGADLRPDGVHFTNDTAERAARWLGPRLVAAHVARTGVDTTLLR